MDIENKKHYSTSISIRSEIASLHFKRGYWESDTIVKKRAGKNTVAFTLLEKKTENYIAIRVSGKTSKTAMGAMKLLYTEPEEHFS